jgi:hypothetical protein
LGHGHLHGDRRGRDGRYDDRAWGMRAASQVQLLLLAAMFFAASATAQTTTGDQPKESLSSASKDWSFSLATFGYLVPDDLSYASPTFTADRDWLHLEGRYNYENQRTGSLWAGYNFSTGHNLVLEVTPMFGIVFGNVTGVAPGYELSLSYSKIELTSQGEYVFDTGDSNASFFYSWNELTYSPTEWCHVGLVSQRTRAYQTPLDVQRGVSLGFAYRKWDYTTYVFNAGWTDPTVVLALTYKF